MVEVVNLATGIGKMYELPHWKSVVMAWHESRGEDAVPFDLLPLFIGERTVACGDFCTWADHACLNCKPYDRERIEPVEGLCPHCGRHTLLWRSS